MSKRQEMKDPYSSDYYRMTGQPYHSGIKSFVRKCLFHNLRYMFWYRKYPGKQKLGCKRSVVLSFAQVWPGDITKGNNW